MPQTPTGVGLAVLELARAGRFHEIRDRFTPPLVPDEIAGLLERAGAPA